MEQGIYEQLISQLIKSQLDELSDENFFTKQTALDFEESSTTLSQHVQKVVKHALAIMPGKKEELINKRIELTNKIILLLRNELQTSNLDENLLHSDKILKAVLSKQLGITNLENHVNNITPYTRINQSELFTGGSAGIELGSEIRKEILSADRIDFLVSFIKWQGIRVFQKELSSFVNRGGQLRVITTTYMGATDAKAIDYLSGLENTEVKVSYNTEHERLHAKAYLFHRNTGFHTGYIGSSNFSRSALTNGLEWNLKITTKEIGHIIDKFQKTFESYWQSNEFETYNKEKDLPKLSGALKSAKFSKSTNRFSTFFDIKPYTYQQEILDKLEVERSVHENTKNLIVAATGTGKTIISAFDYHRFKKEHKRTNLLFIAHRKEILEQSMDTFQAILKDNNFGEIWDGKNKPTSYAHVFASVQTFTKKYTEIEPDFYDYIVIDEVHHIKANSYQPILNYFKPKILLGLTATPERMDGGNILRDFSNKISAEIRLPEALNRKLLCPFQYFGITDNTDLKNVSWSKGKYDNAELTTIYTASDRRVRDIIKNLENYCLDINETRTLGFCVTQAHAAFMTEKFLKAGLKAACLTSDTAQSERQTMRTKLQNKEINYLFVVDIFNEGVDIPAIDTVLFLRPTESLTVFLQQLGRGLRLADGKDCLTVLDFVSNARPEYDFESKFRALIGRTNNPIKDEVRDDFPHLPLGCSIVLEKKAKQWILENITKATSIRRNELIHKIQLWDQQTNLPLTLKNFSSFHHIKLQYIYKRDTWSRLLHDAGKLPNLTDTNEKNVKTMISKKWLSTNSMSYFKFIKFFLDQDCKIELDALSKVEQQMGLMLHYDFWGANNTHVNLESSIQAIAENKFFLEELKEVIDIKIAQIDFIEKEIDLPYAQPLQLHARYTRDQILAAFGFSTFDEKSSNREGVAFKKDLNTEILFVNLIKSEENFSPTTMYDDYAITESIFHWQSQNKTRPDSGKGQSYINHEKLNKKILLFIREQSKDEFGNTMGYVFIGDCSLMEHAGSQPMNITWALAEPIPSYLLGVSKKMVG